MNKPIAISLPGGHYMQPWYDEYRFQVYRQWRRKQGLPPDDDPNVLFFPKVKLIYKDFQYNTDANKAVTP